MKKQRTVTLVIGAIAIAYGALTIISSQHSLPEIFVGLMMVIGGIGALLMGWSMRLKENHAKSLPKETIKRRFRIIKKTSYSGAFFGSIVVGYGLLKSGYSLVPTIMITAISIIIAILAVSLILRLVGRKLNEVQ